MTEHVTDAPMRIRLRFSGLLMVLALALALTACGWSHNWSQFRADPSHSGVQPFETKINTNNVGTLNLAWTALTDDAVVSSPAVANGVAYVGSYDHKLYAFNATGGDNCSGVFPQFKTCPPLWTATLAGAVTSSPAVANGVVYVKSSAFGGIETMYAFDAGGNTNCSGSPKTCAPLWSAIDGVAGSEIVSSPTIVNGIVYVGSDDGALHVYDAAGIINCSGMPKTCKPLWTAPISNGTRSSPAVVNGIVYIGNQDGNLYAFDAAGTINCSGSPKTCASLWSAPTNSRSTAVFSSPAVDHGAVYIGSDHGGLYAFDAAGSTNCSGTPKICEPLWTADTAGYATESSPAVANGIVYIGSDGAGLYAFDAAGIINCSGTPKSCEPLWTAPTIGIVASSPAVANGIVYVGSFNRNFYAFDATGVANCSGTPKTCTSLWTAPTNGAILSSPAVANGTVYVGADDGRLYAYRVP
jgi:outer membrane protein assembly factor BamB